MSEARTVLITGAAGFVAQSVARLLAVLGCRVTGLDRVEPAREGAAAFAKFWRRDLLDDGELCRVVTDGAFDTVVHLAGLLPNRAARHELFAVNVGGTSAVLEHFATRDTQLVLFSTGLVYGEQTAPFREDMPCLPRDPYAQSKLAAEALALAWGRSAGAKVAVLRPSVLYGPGAPEQMFLASLLRALRQRQPFEMTSGEQQRDFLHVDDAARAVAAVIAQRAEGTWNLASGESHSIRAAAELGAALAGQPDLLRIGALPYRDREVFDYRLDASALQRALGWQPRVKLADGLRGMWEAMR